MKASRWWKCAENSLHTAHTLNVAAERNFNELFVCTYVLRRSIEHLNFSEYENANQVSHLAWTVNRIQTTPKIKSAPLRKKKCKFYSWISKNKVSWKNFLQALPCNSKYKHDYCEWLTAAKDEKIFFATADLDSCLYNFCAIAGVEFHTWIRLWMIHGRRLCYFFSDLDLKIGRRLIDICHCRWQTFYIILIGSNDSRLFTSV